jgi:nucleotide-binding universal stress UspA family protein
MGRPGIAFRHDDQRAEQAVRYVKRADRRDEIPATFIVPVDGSEPSFRAASVAATYGGRFKADVILSAALAGAERQGSETPGWLDQVITGIRYPRVSSMLSRDDDASDAITALIAEAADPVVCMATHGQDTPAAAALGSVATQVLREVGVPVVLVGRHYAERSFVDGPLVVCHDGSPAADAVLAPARAWARALGLLVVVVHVVHRSRVESVAAPPAAIAAAIDFLGCTHTEVVRTSHPAGAIRDVVHEHDASLVALSTHGSTGAADTAMGSVAAWVARESPCPLLVARPLHLTQSDAQTGSEVR